MATQRTRAKGKTAKSPPRGPAISFAGIRIWRWVLFLGLSGVLLLCSLIAGVFLYYTSDGSLPTIDKAGDYRPKVITRVLSRDGQVIGEIFEERRTVVKRDRIPRVLINAIVDAEDAEFFQHQGLSYWGMLRAFLHDLKPGAHMHGASTITQQLVRTYVLKSDARTLRRKVQEMYLSLRLEQKLKDKGEILWIYLNQIYLGHNRYGVEEISRFFFGKSVSDITLAEAAVLASLPKGPEQISPRHDPARAKERQRYVLSQMVRYHHITEAEAKKAADEPIRLIPEPPSLSWLAPEYVDEVERALADRFGQKQLPYLGLSVRTTCDLEVQRAAREALERGLQRIDDRTGNRRALRRLSGADRAAYVQKLGREYPGGPPPNHIVEGMVTQVEDGDGQSGAGAVVSLGGAITGWLPLPAVQDRYNVKGLPPKKRFGAGDVLRVRVAHGGKDGLVLALESGPQGAVMVLSPETREILAMVGGYGFPRGGFNRALKAKRQPGSSFKPFLYAAAFDTRRYTPASIVNDSPQVYDLPGMAPWKPHNAEHNEYLGPVRLRVALAKSLNTVASQLIYEIKPDLVIATARAAGIESDLESNYSLALGTSVVSLQELTDSYATFAARGRHGKPFLLLQVGVDEKAAAAELSQAMSPELSYVMSSMLQSVFEEGTAISAKGKLHRPVAGKTGTTNSQKDAWFVGYTPDVAAGVWVGFDDMRVLGEKEQGARAALPIWVETMQAALRTRKVVPFVQPPGVVVQRIDPQSGNLAATGTPLSPAQPQPQSPAQPIDEVFLEGTAPTQQALAPGESDPNNFNQEPE